MNSKTLTFFRLIIFILILNLFFTPSANADNVTSLTAIDSPTQVKPGTYLPVYISVYWQYSRDLTIINSGTPLTDYQVLVNLTGISFPIEANTSGADIRFTDANGSELAYWIENWDFTNMSGQVWVNVTNIPAGASMLRMWYGNPSATSSSNGEGTFLMFDDFEYTDSPSNHGWTISKNDLSIVETSVDYVKTGSRSLKFTYINGYIGLAKTELLYGNSTTEIWLYDQVGQTGREEAYIQYGNNEKSVLVGVGEWLCGSNYEYFVNGEPGGYCWLPRSNGWHLLKIEYTGSNYKVYIDNKFINTIGSTVGAPTELSFGQWWGDNAIFYYDAVRVHKYASPEPYIAGYMNGTVQNNGTGIAEAIVTTNTGVNTNTNAFGFYSMLLPSGEYHLIAFSEPEFNVNNSITANVVAGTTVLQDIELVKKQQAILAEVYLQIKYLDNAPKRDRAK